MSDNTWLANLKAGDRVIIKESYRDLKLSTVKRVTKTQIITESKGAINDQMYETKWRVKDGNLVGADIWSNSYLMECDEANLKRLTIERLKAKALSLRNKLGIPQTVEELEAFIAAVTPLVKEPQ